jgi:hypothetical protein
MDEKLFWAHCTLSAHYCSLKEQKAAIASSGHPQPTRRTLSKTCSTYVHFVVQIGVHWAAVQLMLKPFSVKGILAQTYYECRYRYASCCPATDVSSLSNPVKDVVQAIYDAYYAPGWWDCSSKDW